MTTRYPIGLILVCGLISPLPAAPPPLEQPHTPSTGHPVADPDLSSWTLQTPELRASLNAPSASIIPDFSKCTPAQLRLICIELYQINLEQRREISELKNRLDQTTQDLHAAQQAAAVSPSPLQSNRSSFLAAQPAWDIQYSVGFIQRDGKFGLLEITDQGPVIIDESALFNRRQIVVRGTFYNQTRASYQYSFEIAVHGAATPGDRKIIGSTQHRTPVLGPDLMHHFEIKVPLDADIDEVTRVVITNVSADSPQPAAAANP